MNGAGTSADLVRAAYARLERNLGVIRSRLGRPLTLAEKVLLGHLRDPEGQDLRPGEGFLFLDPDRLAMQDATAQMALLQFMHAGRSRSAAPATVHCDHLIQARVGALEDTEAALRENGEVYDFLQSASSAFGIGFWKPGSGIIHQVLLENYAFPGGLLIGTDSHTPNAGGLAMLASGVGGGDAVDVMVGMPWEVRHPRVLGIRLTGALRGWTSPKDVILRLCGILTVKGGTDRILEYFGPGARTISCTGKATIANMGAELGATGSIFPFDEAMDRYLRGTGRGTIADLAASHAAILSADPEVEAEPEKYFERVITIDLSSLEPQIAGPHTPDLVRPISAFAAEVRERGYPEALSAALLGSCTNSSYEDIGRAVEVAGQARARGLRMKTRLLVTPGSEQIRATIERDGHLAALEAIGATVLANACGPCIGQWRREGIDTGGPNSILTSFNRNFPGRNDGSRTTLAFIASPEIVIAVGLAGRLSFNPLSDPIAGLSGKSMRLMPPRPVPDLPPEGFVGDLSGFLPPEDRREGRGKIRIAAGSERLQALKPFPAWDGSDFIELPILLKAKGSCTTDQISPAGPWLRYRGHLERISDNIFLGAQDAFTGEVGKGVNILTGQAGEPLPLIARDYRARGLRWIAVGDENYGEGSSREHAAMSPRFMGAAAIVARSFARIHESNLKKQGLLALTFTDPADYEKVLPGDRMSLLGLARLETGQSLKAILHHANGESEGLVLRHTVTPEQMHWFRAGGALNHLRAGRTGPGSGDLLTG